MIMENDMEWKGKYKSEILMVCHMDARAMYEVGAISDSEMREYDRECLVSQSVGVTEQKPAPEFAGSR
jgi:DNA-binding transcriptional regulator YiaG